MRNRNYGIAFGVLFVVAQIAVAAQADNRSQCVVKDADISGTYEGGCEGGLANGKGRAQGRDLYVGAFLNGMLHGYGEYSWGNDREWATEVYKGNWQNGDRHGYGEASIAISATRHPAFQDFKNKGELVNGRYIMRGLWDGHVRIRACASKDDCISSYLSSREAKPQNNVMPIKDFKGQLSKSLRGAEFILQFPEEQRVLISECLSEIVTNEVVEPGKEGVELNQDTQRKVELALKDKDKLLENMESCILDSKYKSVSISALSVDGGSLYGDRVRVKGVGIFMMGVFVVKKDDMSLNMITVDIDLLDIPDKKKIAMSCDKIAPGCSVNVFGRVSEQDGETVIVADSVLLN